MSPASKIIQEIYESMEQGNIGKLLVALNDTIKVYTAQCMGGNRRGRDGILQLVPAFYRPGTGIIKKTEHFIEQDNQLIVLGNIEIIEHETINPMPFVDVWHFEKNNISTVIFYYCDAQELCNYLNKH